MDELRFWYFSVALNGWKWADSYRQRLNSDFDFQFPAYISHFLERDIACLEVGSGAIASLGGKGVTDKAITVIPTDALADAFSAIIRDFGITSRLPVIQCDAESLLDLNRPDSFHFAYASNCLDHYYNPVSAIQQMFSLVKPSGTVLLGHHINVAVSEDYNGLHQWNLCEIDGRFTVWNRNEKHFIDEKMPENAGFEINASKNQNWITVSPKKT